MAAHHGYEKKKSVRFIEEKDTTHQINKYVYLFIAPNVKGSSR